MEDQTTSSAGRARRRAEATPPRAEAGEGEAVPRSGSAARRRRRGNVPDQAAAAQDGTDADGTRALLGEVGAAAAGDPGGSGCGGGGVGARRRRRQLDLSGAQPANAAPELVRPVPPPSALPLWTRGDREPLLAESSLAIDAEDMLRDDEGAVGPAEHTAALGSTNAAGAPIALAASKAGASAGGRLRGSGAPSSRYAEDPIHGGFVRAVDAPARAEGADDTLLMTRQTGGESFARLTSRLVAAVLTIARGVLAGLSLLHLFLLLPAGSFALPTPFVVYAPLALSTQSVFQALIAISLVAVLDAHVMYTQQGAPDAAGATAALVASSGRGLVAPTGGSEWTRLIVVLYATALLLGTLQTPIDHTLYFRFAVGRLGVAEGTGGLNLNPEPDLSSASAVQWDVASEADACRFGLVTCAAFTRERAALYRSLGIARDALCIAAFLLASVFFAAQPPAPRAFGLGSGMASGRAPAPTERMAVPLINVRPVPPPAAGAGGGPGSGSGSAGVAMTV